MKMKKILISILAFSLTVSLFSGCAGQTPSEVNETPVSEPASKIETTETEVPDEVKAEISPLRWVYLGRQSSYPDIRVAVNSACGVTDGVGSIYINLDGEHEVNNTLYNALRNKGFIESFYNEENEQLLSASVSDTFADLEIDEAMSAVFNCYWDLLPEEDGEEATEFNGSQSLTRAQAMALVMRAVTPVTEDGVPKSDSKFTNSVGETAYTDFASAMNDKCFINIADSSLTKDNFTKSMTRAEFIYMVMNEVYGSEAINAYDISKVELSDCKDGGDISTKQGYTSTNGSALSLEFMLSNPDGGLQTNLYKAVAMASDLSVISSETRWDEPVTKTEAIEILVDTIKTLNPATEETVGINEDEVRAHGKEWYKKYEERVYCDEQTFVDHFTSSVIVGGLSEEEAAFETYTLYANDIKLIEPEDGEINIPDYPVSDDTKPVTTTTTTKATDNTNPVEEEKKPVQTTTTTISSSPDDWSKAPTDTTPAKDYSNIKWGDPIPDNIVKPSGKKAKVVKWVETDGGKFVYINGNYYRSIQDWVDGKPRLGMDIVDGNSWEDYINDPNNEPIKWQ